MFASVPSVASVSATERPGGPFTVFAASPFESARSSSLQIAPSLPQLALAERLMEMSPRPLGVTVTTQCWSLPAPWTLRLTFGVRLVPPCVTLSAWSRIVV